MVDPGLVVVDKAPGMTSHDVVARVRRLAGTRKVGHAGTLDPMATGVLVLGVDRATRLLGHLMLTEKAYDATVRLGVSTTTDDAEGEVTASTPASHLQPAAVEAELGELVGDPGDLLLDAAAHLVLARLRASVGEVEEATTVLSAVVHGGQQTGATLLVPEAAAHLALLRAAGVLRSSPGMPRAVAIAHNVLPHEPHPGDRALTSRLFAQVDAVLVKIEKSAD